VFCGCYFRAARWRLPVLAAVSLAIRVRPAEWVVEFAVEQPLEQRPEEAVEVAAKLDDGRPDFVPECLVEIGGRDAEITADIGDDLADRPLPHLGGDFLLCRQAREKRVRGRVGGPAFGLGIPRRGRPCGAWPTRGGQADGRRREVLAAGGELAKRGFQRRGAT
jgi:hypothetical protein